MCRRELGLARIIMLLLLGQVWVHAIASLCGHAGEGSASAMVSTHALAALVAGLVLRWHEAKTWTRARGAALRSWVRALLDTLPTTPAVVGRIGRAPIAWTAPALSSWAHPLLPDLRGPPALACQ